MQMLGLTKALSGIHYVTRLTLEDVIVEKDDE